MTYKTQQDFETALDAGNLWAEMNNGRYWKLRRNGATKTWKTRPGEFSIPVKAGLKACARITESDATASYYVICADDPNERIKRGERLDA